MASAGLQATSTSHTYSSRLIGLTPTLDDGSQAVKATSSIPSIGHSEWMDLYYRDKGFAAFVTDLFSLKDSIEEEMPPDKGVIDQVLELTTLSKRMLAQKWRHPRITTDDEGGVRLSWRLGSKELRAVVSADPSRVRYLYWQDGTQYDGIPNFGSATLYERLSWLNGSNR